MDVSTRFDERFDKAVEVAKALAYRSDYAAIRLLFDLEHAVNEARRTILFVESTRASESSDDSDLIVATQEVFERLPVLS